MYLMHIGSDVTWSAQDEVSFRGAVSGGESFRVSKALFRFCSSNPLLLSLIGTPSVGKKLRLLTFIAERNVVVYFPRSDDLCQQ